MRVHGSMLLYVHRNHKAHYDGEPRTATSTFTQLLNSEHREGIRPDLNTIHIKSGHNSLTCW